VFIVNTDQAQIRPAPRILRFSSKASYLIVGGLKGICGSLALYMSRHGATHFVVMSRSGCEDEVSQNVKFQLESLGAEVLLVKGDVTDLEAVRGAFQQAKQPIAGIIQGVMLLRVRKLHSIFYGAN
jgi:NAD(P)-dependent dehydrogenase (short-subunit alcohol dehydrogenase family)